MDLEQQLSAGTEATEAPPVEEQAGEEQETLPPVERDWEAEARNHGWTDKESFKGDPDKWVDAKRFMERADEVMPLLKKQNDALKRELQEMRRDLKKAGKQWSSFAQREYERGLAEIQARHEEAVESGDTEAAARAWQEREALEKPPEPETDDAAEEAERINQEFQAWVVEHEWYETDANRRLYADNEAMRMGLAKDWPGGPTAWLDELAKRVDRKFAPKKVNPVANGGNRSASASTRGMSYGQLSAEEKKICDKAVERGLFKSKEEWIKVYEAQ